MKQETRNQRYAVIRRELSRAVQAICPGWLAARRDDIVQNAVVRLMKREANLEENREFNRSYLWRVAHSALVEEIRQATRHRETQREPEEVTSAMKSASVSPEEISSSHQLGTAILDCLANLISPRRRAVALYLYGHTVRQAGELLGWGRKRTENLIYRGLADLRDCLQKRGFAP